ncbi:MAG: glycosyltransferase family 4 protein [Solirubrobacterales bacterium]|nr:glycosyltransferase family 4 protein [Solirubrobacterales bacterium]
MPSLGSLLLQTSAADGGAETQVWLLARGLARLGYDVCVIVVDISPGLPREFDGVDVILRPPWQGGRGFRGQLAELIALWRVLGPLDASVIVQRAAGLWTGLVALMTSIRRRRFVFSSANLADFDFRALASTSKEVRLFHLGLRLATTIVVQTDEQAARCIDKFHRTPIVIRSIAEPVAAARPRTAQAFLWIGRLVDYKRPEAFVDLARALPEAQFWMVGMPSAGDPGIATALEEEAREMENLKLLPARPRTELLKLYEHGVAIVNTADFEGMPNVFLEGWSRGIPALALSHDPDGLIEANGLGGFAHGSQQELVRLARWLWQRRDDQADLSARCRDYVGREHSASAVITQWIAALGLPSICEESQASAAIAWRVNKSAPIQTSIGRSRRR